ncbi:hypothetical protein YPPY98_3581, partial [Yersinia pestis PY-98]
MIYFTLII